MKVYIGEVFKLALPIIFGQLGIMLIGAGDVFVASKFSTQTLAAIGVANGIQGPIVTLGVGLMIGVAPVLSQMRGEGHDSKRQLKVVVLYSIIVSFLLMLINYSVIPFVSHFGLKEELVPFIEEYLYITGLSYPGAMLYQGLKEYLQAQERPFFANMLSLMAVFFNIAGNFLLVFGVESFEGIGDRGLAVMSLVTRSAIGLILFAYTWPAFKKSYPVDKVVLKRIVRLSMPLSLAVLAEVFAFSLSSILVGTMDTVQAAAHNLILTMAATSFMIPLAVSSAASVKVGHAFGARRSEQIKKYAFACIIISETAMLFSAMLYFFIPKTLISIFTADQAVMAIAVNLSIVVGVFQIFDGLQITLAGILRGISVSGPILAATLLSHWAIGFPISYYFAFIRQYHALGLWLGLATGLFLLSIALSFILRRNFKQLHKFIHPPA